ncbi:MAG: ABC transporter ATP-binding protein [Lachnospiraceae bacterium]
MIKVLVGQVKQYKACTIKGALYTVLEVFMELLIPLTAASIIDKGVSQNNLGNIMLYGLLMICMASLSLTFGILAGRTAATASTGYAANLRNAMYENIQTYSFSNIDKFSTAGLITRLTTDVTNVQNSYQMIMRMCLRAPVSLICALLLSFMINPQIASIFLVGMLFLGVIFAFIIKYAMRYFNEVFRKYDDLNASVQENVSAIRVVKAFVREDYEKKKFDKAATNVYKLFIRAEKIVTLNSPALMFTMYGCMIALSWFSAQYIVIGTMTTGNLTSFYSYCMTIMMSLMMLSMVFVMMSMSIASAKRIAEVLQEQAEIVNPQNPIMEVKDGSIVFRDVEFSYYKDSERSVLENINISIQAGQTIGVLGGTGSGKTSFINLISRLYDVGSGEVIVGGHNVKEYDVEVLRNQVAVVLQKNELFTGTILENLRWGDEHASEEACIRACELACASDFIERMPDGYHTFIEQGGSNVSGGQKQRLCIARAILKQPKVLILDDSTSAVDTTTDSKIRKAFREELPDMTKLIISQRVSSIEDADKIIVLDDGKVNAFDTHENLLEQNEIYRSVYESQTQGSGDFDEKGGE